MLRRLKTDVDFVIPPKREVVVYAQLSALQQEMYRCILNKTIEQLVKAPSETPVSCQQCHLCENYVFVLHLLFLQCFETVGWMTRKVSSL